MKLKNFSLSALLALSFAAIVLVMLVIGTINLSSLFTINHATDMNDLSYKVLSTGELMQINALNIETGSRGYLLSATNRTFSLSSQVGRLSKRNSTKR